MHKQLAGVLACATRRGTFNGRVHSVHSLTSYIHQKRLSTAGLPRFKGARLERRFLKFHPAASSRVDELIPDRRYEFIHRAELRLTKMDLEEEVCANPSRSARNIYRQGGGKVEKSLSLSLSLSLCSLCSDYF